MVSFAVKRLLISIESYLFIFVFLFITLVDQKDPAVIYVKECPVYIYLLSFVASGLKFRYLIHFGFMFVYGVRECSNFILLHVAVQFSKHHLLKRLSFLHCIALPPLSYINWPEVHGFISGFSMLFHWSIFLFSCQYHTVLITVVLLYSLKSGNLISLVPFFFLRIPMAIQGYPFMS